jgi:hypothetical protein
VVHELPTHNSILTCLLTAELSWQWLFLENRKDCNKKEKALLATYGCCPRSPDFSIVLINCASFIPLMVIGGYKVQVKSKVHAHVVDSAFHETVLLDIGDYSSRLF